MLVHCCYGAVEVKVPLQCLYYSVIMVLLQCLVLCSYFTVLHIVSVMMHLCGVITVLWCCYYSVAVKALLLVILKHFNPRQVKKKKCYSIKVLLVSV